CTTEYAPWYHGVIPHRLTILRAAYEAGVRPPPVGPPSDDDGARGDTNDDDSDDEGGPDAQHR
ncbi:hypothetical protein KI387_043415, partial [Taxus chinensis]